MTTIERILELQEESGMNNKALETAVGLTNASITSWKKGKYAPGVDAIVKLAQFFHVSTDYLLCLSDARTHEVGISLSEEERLLIEAYRTTNVQGRFNIIHVCMSEKGKGEAVLVG